MKINVPEGGSQPKADQSMAGANRLGGKNKIFAYSILGLNTLLPWLCWWILEGSISGRGRHIWLYPILVFSIWGIAFTLSAMFVKNRWLVYSSFAIGVIGYPLFFGFNLSIAGVAIAFLLFVFTERQTKKESERGIKINFYQLVSHTLKYFVTAVCLVIAVAYYVSIADKPSSSPSLLETKTLETEMDWGLKAAGYVLPDDKRILVDDINSNVTVDDFLSKNFVQPEIDDTSSAFGNASGAAKLIGNTAAIEMQQQILDKSKRDLAKQLGVDVVGEQPMKNVLMAYIDKTERSFFDYSGTDKFYIPVILALGIFLTARILGTAVDLVLGLLILGIIKLLRMSDIIQVSHEQREVTMIDYSI